MSEVVVRSIAHVSKIYDRASIFPGGVNHLAERRIFVPFSGRLDHEIGKAPVEDGVKGINVDLVKAPCGFAVRLKKSVGIVRVSENVNRRTVAGNEFVFPAEKIFA